MWRYTDPLKQSQSTARRLSERVDGVIFRFFTYCKGCPHGPNQWEWIHPSPPYSQSPPSQEYKLSKREKKHHQHPLTQCCLHLVGLVPVMKMKYLVDHLPHQIYSAWPIAKQLEAVVVMYCKEHEYQENTECNTSHWSQHHTRTREHHTSHKTVWNQHHTRTREHHTSHKQCGVNTTRGLENITPHTKQSGVNTT